MKLLIYILIIVLPLKGVAQSFQNIKISGPNEDGIVDTVTLPSGKKALQTSGLVQIDQLFGRDPQGSTFFYIGSSLDANGVGAAGDTVRVEIAAAEPPLNAIYPAVDVTTTVTPAIVADPNPERALAQAICTDLDNDANFTASQWRCIVMSDFSGVFIHSNLYNEFGFREGCVLPLKCFSATSTGTTVITEVYNEITGRGYSAELQRSPNDPRKGVLAISGSISINSESVSNIIATDLVNGVYGASMVQDGSATPLEYEFLADPTNVYNFYIQKVSCYCQGNGIQLANYCSLNSPASTGTFFSFISEGTSTTYAVVKSTADFKHLLTLGDTTQYALDIPSGTDDLMATSVFNPPIILLANSGDKITVTINDNLTQLTEHKCRVFGFRRRR